RAGAWALRRNDVIGLALVGSHARGQARPDSDIDLVVVAERPQNLLANAGWVRQMGNVGSWVDAFIIEPGDTGASRRKPAIEDWGRVQSVRIHYDDGPEVEFGVTGADWALEPDEATLDVVRAGMRILYDRDGSLASMLDR
ncbi:MAG: nucleotidyltransferase domain-containing protein, partial [Planctomycetota bacterium]|nr:nucleotidyltransferase domain-containing protein [Planctomycetota bacterium]